MKAAARAATVAAVLVLTSTAVGIGVLEIALRVFVPPRVGTEMRALHVLRPDRPWLYDMRPGAHVRSADGIDYSVNAAGFRGPLVQETKPAGTFRILVLGDSVTFGWGVDEASAYPARLGQLLAAESGTHPVDVVNLGVSGYNPYTEAALFAHRGVDWQPDLVLVQFCVNDLNDPTMHFDASTAVQLAALPVAAFPDPTTRRASSVRRSFHCAGWRVCQLLEDALLPQAPTDPAALRAALLMREAPSPGEVEWLTARYRDIDRAATAAGARVALVVFPFSSQLDGSGDPPLQRALRGIAERLGWAAIDVLPDFRAARRDGAAPLFLDPWHPTAEGHAVVARRLACAGLVPGRRPAECSVRRPASAQ